jgi:hypothetical protein
LVLLSIWLLLVVVVHLVTSVVVVVQVDTAHLF